MHPFSNPPPNPENIRKPYPPTILIFFHYFGDIKSFSYSAHKQKFFVMKHISKYFLPYLFMLQRFENLE